MTDIDDFSRDNSFLQENKAFLKRHPFLKLIHDGGDRVIILCGEGFKSVVRECYHLSYQVVNSWCAILIDFISTSNYNESRRNRIVKTAVIKNEESKEVSSLKSVQHLLDYDKSDADYLSEEVKSPTVQKQLSQKKKKDYNAKTIPAKIERKRQNPEKKVKSKSMTYFVFYPLFILYPLFVHCLHFYMWLWSIILPDYSIHNQNSHISTSRLPSDIDVNSEAISGLLEDLQVALFRLIHRSVQGIRYFWLSCFDPNSIRSFFVGLLTLFMWVLGVLRSFFHLCFSIFRGDFHISELLEPSNSRYKRWQEWEQHINSLLQSYLGTLEANRPPTIFNKSSTPIEVEESFAASLLTKPMLGYPLEEYSVHTVDRYCLVLFRIPRPESRRVVYFQHGVMDTALAWVSDKPSLSLAIQAYQQGYDVFFGSFRGTDGHYASDRKRHEVLDVSDAHYWDYNIDDLTLDYRAFLESIYVIKEQERAAKQNAELAGSSDYSVQFKREIMNTEYRNLNESELHRRYTLHAVSHSMGGAVTLAYIALSHLTHTAHHLSNVVLLSPAGFLADQSWIVRVLNRVSPLLFTERSPPTAFPTRSSRVHLLVAKLLQDMQTTPATLELVNQICAMVIGGEPRDWPFQKVNYTKYPLGVTSLYVMLQFRQWYCRDAFTSFDYPGNGNELRYGQREPVRYTDFYEQFDVPIHFIAGKHDSIVPSTQVFRHYTKLLPVLGKRTSYVEFENAGHLQFTIGLDHDVISYVLYRLNLGEKEGYHGLKTEKKEPQRKFGYTNVDTSNRSYLTLSWSVCWKRRREWGVEMFFFVF